MSTATPQRETFLPGVHPEQLAPILDMLRGSSAADDDVHRYFLSGADPGDQVEIPAEVRQVLHQVVEAMRQGLAVTVVPQTMVLTTQQAADLLGVSRPTLIKLLSDDQIPYERIGTHRRIQLRDLLTYREQRRAAQYAALDATSAPIDDEEDAATVLASLRQARKVIAQRRRDQAGMVAT
jgi:excisionase family DNA binding protein